MYIFQQIIVCSIVRNIHRTEPAETSVDYYYFFYFFFSIVFNSFKNNNTKGMMQIKQQATN